MNPHNRELMVAAKEQMKKRPKRRPLSTFAKPPAPKSHLSGFRRQQSY